MKEQQQPSPTEARVSVAAALPRMHRICGICVATALSVGTSTIPAAAQPHPTGALTTWHLYNGNLEGTRYSPLSQIDRSNVHSLGQVGRAVLPETTEFVSSPVVAANRLFVTTATSTYAIDASTGNLLWAQHYHPKSLGLGTGNRGVAYHDGRLYRGTPDGHLIYAPVGNPGPDFAGAYRPGRNLYTDSVVKLDARTGALRGYHQFVAHDIHDWDIAASPVLFTSRDGHQSVAVGGKDGYLYGLDRDLSKVKFTVPIDTIKNVKAPLTVSGTRFCPGTQGGVNWYGPAYSPQQNALYVDSIDWCTMIKLAPAGSFKRVYGKPFVGSTNGFGYSDPKRRSGWIFAVDADTGKVLWRRHTAMPAVASLTPTAGGIVFTGDLEGRQYVAVASGMKNAIMETRSGPAAVVIYALPSTAARRASVRRATSRH